MIIDPTKKHIILLKLNNLNDQVPSSIKKSIATGSEGRHWLSSVGAVLSAIDIEHKVRHKANMNLLIQYRDFALNSIFDHISDTIEELKLDLELDGRSEIGSVYEPGEVYSFYSDLKNIISSVQQEILIVDPYFDGKAFDAYLSSIAKKKFIKILADRYSKGVGVYVKKHIEQFKSKIEQRQSKELHDRLLIVDNSECWIIGQSIKDAAKKATYLIPLTPGIADRKIKIYHEIWNRATKY